MFAPRNMEMRFLHYFLSHRRRPSMVVLILQHYERPMSMNLLERHATFHTGFRGRYHLLRSEKNTKLFVPYYFNGIIHLFFIPKLDKSPFSSRAII